MFGVSLRSERGGKQEDARASARVARASIVGRRVTAAPFGLLITGEPDMRHTPIGCCASHAPGITPFANFVCADRSSGPRQDSAADLASAGS